MAFKPYDIKCNCSNVVYKVERREDEQRLYFTTLMCESCGDMVDVTEQIARQEEGDEDANDSN